MTDPVANMVHRLSTHTGKAPCKLRKQPVEPLLGIIEQSGGWRQMRMRGPRKARGNS